MGARRDIGSPDRLSFDFAAQGAGVGRARSAPPDWYDVTWNPTVGCSAISPGCDHCQALRTVAQLARMGGKGGARYAGLTATRRILVDSLSDLFHETLAVETIDALHAVMAVAHWHRFLVLTKRADHMRAYYADPQTPYRIAAAVDDLATTILPSLGFSGDGATPAAAI